MKIKDIANKIIPVFNSEKDELQQDIYIEQEEHHKDNEQQKESPKKEEVILEKLVRIYNNCDKINDTTLVDKIERLEIEEKTEKINESIKCIIAKKIAVDCMKYGGPKLPTMMRIMPATEMLEINLPFLAEEEYHKVKKTYEKSGKKYYEYDDEQQKLVKQKILENIAKEVVKNFEEIGDISIPSIEALKSLNDEEIHIFVNAIKHLGHKRGIGKEEVEIVKKQLKGTTVGEWKNLKRMLEKMKSKDREIAIKKIMSVLNENRNKTEHEKALEREIDKIGEYIRKIPIEEKRIDTAKSIIEVLEHQNKIYNKDKEKTSARKTDSNEER